VDVLAGVGQRLGGLVVEHRAGVARLAGKFVEPLAALAEIGDQVFHAAAEDRHIGGGLARRVLEFDEFLGQQPQPVFEIGAGLFQFLLADAQRLEGLARFAGRVDEGRGDVLAEPLQGARGGFGVGAGELHRGGQQREFFRRRADRGRHVEGLLAELAHLLGEFGEPLDGERDAEDLGHCAEPADRTGERRDHTFERLVDTPDAAGGFLVRRLVVA
jgi:hypothetical protein